MRTDGHAPWGAGLVPAIHVLEAVMPTRGFPEQVRA